MKKKIAIIGANDQQNPLILKAGEMGFETHTFAWQTGGEIGEKTSDCFYPISANSKEEILAKCREIGVDATVSIGSDIAAGTCAYVAQALALPGNRYESVRRATNKILTRKTLAAHGILQPAHVEIGDTIPFDALNALRYPLVVKPSDRSGGRGLRIVQSADELFGAIGNARETSFERKAIVEEFIDGQLYSCECLSFGGAHYVVGFTKRDAAITGSHVCEYRHTQPAVLPLSAEKTMRENCRTILDALGLHLGASSIEFIVGRDNRVYIIEVTPSMYGDYIGTDLIPHAYGYDYTKAVLEIACGKTPRVPPKSARAQAQVLFSYDKQDGTRTGHTVTESPIREFGGALPLRLPQYTPYYPENDTTLAFNSEYTAFAYALAHTNAKRVHLPYYASSAWEKAATECGAECVFYHIDARFLPIGIDAGEGDAVLLVNYHGLCGEYIKNARFPVKIVDNSQSFFTEPIMEENTFNIYAARKFFAVPDGAYLISSSLRGSIADWETDVSYKRARALLLALECGAGAAYKEQQTNEQELVLKRAGMSALTRRLLSAVDYEAERRMRARNFAILHKFLQPHNTLSLDPEDNFAPQFYPLLVSADIRSLLIGKKIYIPLLWRKTLSEEFDGFAEKTFSEKLICLPIEPDYSENDMEYLAETVIASLS